MSGASAEIKNELLSKFAGKNSKWVKKHKKQKDDDEMDVDDELPSGNDNDDSSEEETYAVS